MQCCNKASADPCAMVKMLPDKHALITCWLLKGAFQSINQSNSFVGLGAAYQSDIRHNNLFKQENMSAPNTSGANIKLGLTIEF